MTENELLVGHRLLRFHCSAVLREGAMAWPCAEFAVEVHRAADGSRRGWCRRHLDEGRRRVA